MSTTIPLVIKSQRACMFCRERKQSCDKALPKCSRCDLKKRRCDYSFNKFLPRSETTSQKSHPALGPIVIIRELCGCLEITPEDGETGLSGRCSGLSGERSTAHSHGDYTTHLFRSVIDAECDGFRGLIDRYIKTVQRWLPILNKEALEQAINKPQDQFLSCVNTHACLLFLSMRLVSQGRCSSSLHDAGTSSLYLTTRRLFILFHDEEEWPLSLLQAGILIATYECGHGLAKSSYLTLSSCVAMARLMRIDQGLASQLNAGPEDAPDPQVLCWSAIVMLDRLIALASVDDIFPLLVPPPPDSSFETSLECLQTRLTAAKKYEKNHWSFESTAAAAEMIGEALTFAPNSSRVPIQRLDLVKLRTDKLVAALLEISQIAPLLTCEVAPLSISAVAAVRLRCAISGDEQFISCRATEELRSTFEMKLDEIRMAPDPATGPGMNRISLLVLCSMFRSVLHLARYYHKELLEADLRRIKSCLLAFREHWALGDLYLKELNKILALSK
ncbi:unnamed protein product [Clonostachys rosea]|uniref:Zn(2)-C6 fungal-type domain-containing protein n=1 Tax=Bionectria ochroleuca TaxID=29856 RepID=A0ABY6TZK2_BIOOC|nr:unnamed protein product [Clonostachys rosea]